MAIVFQVCLVILGAFFLLQVILAIIMQAFDEVDEKQKEEAKARKKKTEESIKMQERFERKQQTLREQISQGKSSNLRIED